MAHYTYKGKNYPEISIPVFAEIRYAEKLLEKHMEQMSSSEQFMCEFLLAVRRVDPKDITWEELLQLSPGVEVIYVEDPPAELEPAELDPTDAVTPTAPPE